MNITLISADDEIWASGMRSISSTLREAGHVTTMIFAGAAEASLDSSVMAGIVSLAGDSEIIGISSMSRGSSRAKALLQGLRHLGKLLVWGGMHPTIYPEECTAHADLVCRGEGEGFMLELVERVASGRGITDIPNGAYLSDDRVVMNELRPLIADLDTLPFPDYAFQNEYCLDRAGHLAPHLEMRDAERPMFSGSRGCNYNCTYCSNSQLKTIYKGHGRYARKMSVPAAVTALKNYCRIFPKVKTFYFTDEDFFARHLDEMADFTDRYGREIGLPFMAMASPRDVTEEKMALAVKAGLWKIDVGLESGSERTRREIFNRHIDDATQMRAAITISKQKRVIVSYFLILGNPYEERQDLLESIRFLQKMPTPFFLRAYNLVFIPGTKLFNRACRDGTIHGLSDSACEIDFLAGFRHEGYAWKRKNLYLNSLTSMMVGKSTVMRMGYLPKALIPALTGKRMIAFCESHSRIGESIMALSNFGLRVRRAVAILAGRLLPDYRIVYDLKGYWKRLMPSHTP